MISPLVLVLAFLLDALLGDPRWLPHPVTLIGKAITALEGFLRVRFEGEKERTAGILLVVAIVLPTGALAFVIGWFLLSFSNRILMVLGTALFVYLVSTTLALRDLVHSTRFVTLAIKRGEIVEARQNLAMIVGRDTDTLGEVSVLRAAIETVAENLSDGFVAPLFYLMVGGLPLAMAYKAINTLDSMVGYKNPQYIRFGWAAARLDDIANYIPARIAGFFISGGAFIYFCFRSSNAGLSHALFSARSAFTMMLRDGRNHSSPNSGMCEAAMAGALGVRLGGPSTYGGSIVVKPYIGDALFSDYRAAADAAIAIVAISSSLAVAFSVLIVECGRLI